jgi:hypothetical protein
MNMLHFLFDVRATIDISSTLQEQALPLPSVSFPVESI